MDAVVTTNQNPSRDLIDTAQSLAKELETAYVERSKRSLAVICEACDVENVLVVTKQGPVIHTPGGEYFFHLSMAELRIKNLRNGKHDHMVAAMSLEPGMTVLDCTLGLGTDAIVASVVAGENGKIVGVENSALIATVTKLGLKSYVTDDKVINQAMRNIVVKQADYLEYLACLADKAFDIVYFDPMFRTPITSSSNLRPIRYLADARPLSTAAVEQACRIAKRRVVMKETEGSKEFERLGFCSFVGGKYSSIKYGVIDLAVQEGG